VDYQSIIDHMSDENRENMRAWLKELRSGEYEQGTQSLHPGQHSYCCLGVACETFKKATGRGEWSLIDDRPNPCFKAVGTDEEKERFDVDGSDHALVWADSATLPIVVADWLFGDYKEINPRADFKSDQDFTQFVSCGLAESNDGGLTFKEIADAIERTYLK
jgi:hypothetical protein